MRTDIDRALTAMAALREGAFTRDDARSCGANRALLARRVAAGRVIAHPGEVFVLAGVPPTLAQRRWIALLAGGPTSHLSHETAGELYGARSVPAGLVVVTVPAPLHLEIPGVTFHQLADVAPDDLTVVAGFPVTTPARTIVDLAAVVGPLRLRAAVEHVVVERLATFSAIAGVLRRVRRRGKPGVRKLVLTLDALDGRPPPASVLERLLHAAARRAGVPFVPQFPLPWVHEPIVGVVDIAVVESKLILESDGRSWHTRTQDQAKDARRDRAAARAGWQTLRFVWRDLADDLDACADDIRATHRRRLDSQVSARRIPAR